MTGWHHKPGCTCGWCKYQKKPKPKDPFKGMPRALQSFLQNARAESPAFNDIDDPERIYGLLDGHFESVRDQLNANDAYSLTLYLEEMARPQDGWLDRLGDYLGVEREGMFCNAHERRIYEYLGTRLNDEAVWAEIAGQSSLEDLEAAIGRLRHANPDIPAEPDADTSRLLRIIELLGQEYRQRRSEQRNSKKRGGKLLKTSTHEFVQPRGYWRKRRLA